ncbi:29546641-b066-46d2-abd9-b8e29d684a55 [Sclerotinia trifoliorum]|uniref:29546641-b066-46d2-abd9-b8e29d684a55 n=1 Tax=Sclerotinia trifoliorum TaxID=28548 RepID=A0A8H2ZU04_9HELO|nr:29546641-b066-46d2-abd9-b8e29d684a55 [Sclerotinia trifoliorum]
MYLSTVKLDAEAISFLSIPIHPSITEPNVYITGDSQIQRWSSLIGIVTAIVGNILISFALNIQRYAHIRLHDGEIRRKERLRAISKSAGGYGTGVNGNRIDEEEYEAGEEEPLLQSFHSQNSQSSTSTEDDHGGKKSTYLQSPYWWGGIVLMTIGELGNFLAYGFAPASIVSPLGVVALISNCVIAPIMLNEQFRLRDFWGVVVAVAGAVTVVLSAKQEEKKFGPHEIWGAITTTEFELYMGITVVLIAILMWASPRYGRKTILVDLGLVGLFGGYTALSTKGVSSMLSSTLWRALTTPVTYFLVLVLVATAIMQVRYLNRALQRFDSTQVIPVQFVIFTLSVITGSAILYRDFEKVTSENAVKFIGGCLLTFFGVWLITSGRPPHDEDEDEDESEVDIEGEEERIRLAPQEAPGDEALYHNGSRKQSSLQPNSKPSLIHDGDGSVDEEAIQHSRRSSHVSFAKPTSRPQTPQRPSSKHPAVRLHTPGLSDERSASVDNPLPSNPWVDSNENLLQTPRHPGIQTSISSPVLPSEAQSPPPLRPPTTRNNTQSHFHTPPSQQNSPSPPQAEQSMTPASYSIARMLPGPLLSPLSGGLSVVIADSLRRGVDSPRSKSQRRPQPDLRRSKSISQRLIQASEGTVDDEDVDAPLKDNEAAQDVEEGESFQRSIRTRARSLSNTLGEFLRGRSRDERVDDEEAGPSGP